MKSHRSIIKLSFLPVIALVALAGCNEESKETETGATPDPLTGDWSGAVCFGSAQKPAEVESCKTTLSFSKDLDFSMEAAWVNLAATTDNPGCTTTKRVTGQKWATDHETNTLTITGTSHATMERAKCVNEKDNLQTSATNDISIQAGKYRYSIDDDGDTLNIESGPLRGAFTR